MGFSLARKETVYIAIDKGSSLTDGRMRALDKRLQAIYNAAYKTAIEREQAAIAKLAAFDVEALRAQGLDDTAIRAKQLAYKATVERETQMLKNIAAEIAKTGETAAKIIQGEKLNVYDIGYRSALTSIDKQIGFQIDWTIYDKNQLKVLLDSEKAPFTKLAYKKLGKDTQVGARLQNQLTISVINGESVQQIAKRIRGVTRQSYAQAVRVARTEIIRTSNQGRSIGFSQAHDEYDIEMEKQWIATLDGRVREDHAHMHMEKTPLDKDFSNGLEYPGDPDGGPEQVINCRCTMVSVLAGLKGSKAYQELNEKIGKKVPTESPLEEVAEKYSTKGRTAVFVEIEAPH